MVLEIGEFFAEVVVEGVADEDEDEVEEGGEGDFEEEDLQGGVFCLQLVLGIEFSGEVEKTNDDAVIDDKDD